ncbi:hypothetical protein O1L60_03090 [Streptomyces diastatochromogenes]|nr:hypothetical protein [Streptomyces diastatochromogenes]
MHDHDTPAQTGSGLSTDDIARSREREPGPDTGPGRGREQEVRDPDATPMYPGEAIGTGGTDRADDAGDTETASTSEAASVSGAGEGEASADGAPRLMDPGEEESLRARWHDLQSLFVDDPAGPCTRPTRSWRT